MTAFLGAGVRAPTPGLSLLWLLQLRPSREGRRKVAAVFLVKVRNCELRCTPALCGPPGDVGKQEPSPTACSPRRAASSTAGGMTAAGTRSTWRPGPAQRRPGAGSGSPGSCARASWASP